VDAKTRRQMNREMNAVTKRLPRLGEGVGEIAAIIRKYMGEDAASVTEGIYCGEFGDMFEVFEGQNHGLRMQWGYGKLEVAYVS